MTLTLLSTNVLVAFFIIMLNNNNFGHFCIHVNVDYVLNFTTTKPVKFQFATPST